jgi:trehalose 6-phosphate phosphatase
VSVTRPILDPAHRDTLLLLAHSNVLVALDYDGTLAPIADRPEDAFMRPRTRRLLAVVAALYPTIVISGRALADVEQMVGDVPVWFIYGNHGLEPEGPRRPAPEEAKLWRPYLEPLAGTGVRIEDKGHSMTLHYRGAHDRARALAAIEKVVATLPDVTVIQGAEAVNLLPRNRGDKGSALAEARRAFACESAIYVGDEDTDEAAFRSEDGRTLSIRVEPSEQSHAAYHLGSQDDIDEFLQILAAARRQLPDGTEP